MSNTISATIALIKDIDPGMNGAQITSLLFLVQAWSLAIHDKPLFDAQFRAQDSGPRLDDAVMAKSAKDKPAVLSFKDKTLIERVWSRYRLESAADLRLMLIGEGTPWSNAYFGVKRGATILQSDMKSYATRLALHGHNIRIC